MVPVVNLTCDFPSDCSIRFHTDPIRLHERHERYCEEGLMSVMEDFDDFNMAGIRDALKKRNIQ